MKSKSDYVNYKTNTIIANAEEMANGVVDLPRFKEIKSSIDERDFTWLRLFTDALVLVGDVLRSMPPPALRHAGYEHECTPPTFFSSYGSFADPVTWATSPSAISGLHNSERETAATMPLAHRTPQTTHVTRERPSDVMIHHIPPPQGRQRCYAPLHPHRGRTRPADKLFDERASANRSMNRTPQAWFAPATSTMGHQHPPLARNHERERPMLHTKKQRRTTATFVVSTGAAREPPQARGVSGGCRLAAPRVAPKA